MVVGRLSRLPMRSEIAPLADTGRIEEPDKKWLDAAALAVENL